MVGIKQIQIQQSSRRSGDLEIDCGLLGSLPRAREENKALTWGWNPLVAHSVIVEERAKESEVEESNRYAIELSIIPDSSVKENTEENSGKRNVFIVFRCSSSFTMPNAKRFVIGTGLPILVLTIATNECQSQSHMTELESLSQVRGKVDAAGLLDPFN